MKCLDCGQEMVKDPDGDFECPECGAVLPAPGDGVEIARCV